LEGSAFIGCVGETNPVDFGRGAERDEEQDLAADPVAFSRDRGVGESLPCLEVIEVGLRRAISRTL